MRICSVLFAICLFLCSCKSKQACTQLTAYESGKILDDFEFIITPYNLAADFGKSILQVDTSPSAAIPHESTPVIASDPMHSYPSYKIQGKRIRSFEQSTNANTLESETRPTRHSTFIRICVLVIGILFVAFVFRITKF